jgi:hypothetical protein
MKRRIMLAACAVALVLAIPLTFAFAGNGMTGSTGGTGKGDVQTDQLRLRDQEQIKEPECADKALRTRERTQDRLKEQAKTESPAFESSDGKMYKWKNQFTIRAKKFEETQDAEGLHRYLNQVAHRFRFQHEQDAEGFVRWAEENKPWNSD